MKKLLLLITIVIITLTCEAQDRVNTIPAMLAYKSKEITDSKYWTKNTETGKWESRKNTKHIYLGEGTAIENFNSLFIGKFKEQYYLFLDYRKYAWQYPALKMEWSYYRTIMAASLYESDYNSLSSIEVGKTVVVCPRFRNEMFKGHMEYSFPLFLSLTDELRSASEALYESYKKEYGEEYAEIEWEKKYPPISFIVLKRVIGSDGKDIVRFCLYPHALIELIDNFYFEVDYSIYRNLFVEDNKQSYK